MKVYDKIITSNEKQLTGGITIFNVPNEMITKEISLSTLRRCAMAIEEGYVAVNDLIGAFPFLQTPSAKCRHQDLFNFASEYFLEQKCKQGYIPLHTEYRKNTAKNSAYLILSSENMSLTLSSVKYSQQFPRYAIFREQSASLQTTLFNMENYCYSYAILTHVRKQKKNGKFIPIIQLGIPNSEYLYWEELYSLNDLPAIYSFVETESDLENNITIKKDLENIIIQR